MQNYNSKFKISPRCGGDTKDLRFSLFAFRLAKRKRSAAFTLLESLISISILSMATLAMIALLANVTSKMTHAKQRLTAANLAQEGLEIARNIRDTNWLASTPKTANCDMSQYSYNTTWCYQIYYDPNDISDKTYTVQYDTTGSTIDYAPDSIDNDITTILKFDSLTGLYQHSTGADTPYRRLITTELVSTSPTGIHLRVQSHVKWTRGTLNFEIVAEDNLYNWK